MRALELASTSMNASSLRTASATHTLFAPILTADIIAQIVRTGYQGTLGVQVVREWPLATAAAPTATAAAADRWCGNTQVAFLLVHPVNAVPWGFLERSRG
jgi:hypothetical protein